MGGVGVAGNGGRGEGRAEEKRAIERTLMPKQVCPCHKWCLQILQLLHGEAQNPFMTNRRATSLRPR